ncbi:MAG: hypothetical protein AB7E80_14580 [Hyphomicrobiaceae bacterium]
MRTLITGLLALPFVATAALADSKPTEDEAKKITEALSGIGCSGGEMEKETEATGVYEIDDAKCKDGQFDIKLDKDFKLLSVTRD